MKVSVFLTLVLSSIQTVAQFPAAWVGEWQGTLAVERGLSVMMSTEVRLAIHPLDSSRYSWQLSYGDPGDDERPYTLVPADSLGIAWQIDEENGIVLDAYLHGSVLYSRFEVMGNLLFTRDELIGDTLYHEIVSGSLANPIQSGGLVLPKGDTIPIVKSYPISTRQWAKLTRKHSLGK